MRTLKAAVSSAICTACAGLIAGSGDSSAAARICTSADTFLFGNVAVGSSSSATASVASCGDAPLTFTSVAIDPGTGPAFHVSSTCTTGLTLAPGASCTVAAQFAPTAPGQASGALWMHTDSSTPDQLITFYGRGVNGTAGTATLVFVPSTASFAAQPIATESSPLLLELHNVGPGTMTLSAIVLNGPAAFDFRLLGSCQTGGLIVAGGSCYLSLYFRPQALGTRLANLVIDSPQLASLAILQIGGSATPPAPTVDVVEFHNPVQDHYFISSLAPDINALDTGVFPGWARTGLTFKAYAQAVPGASPVCRFYIPPIYGDSHFFSASSSECAQVHVAFPAFIEESPAAMYEDLPDATTGACPLGDVPVYRTWDGRADSNHRYTTDRVVRAQMVARGWIAEGYGPEQVIMCAPMRQP